MGRRQYSHLPLTCHRGVNQQQEKATLEECADALNVWAPDGMVEQRPGYVGVASFPLEDIADSLSTESRFLHLENPVGTFSSTSSTAPALPLDLSNAPLGASWYIGFSKKDGADWGSLDAGERKLIGLSTGPIAQNDNAIRFEAFYRTASGWAPFAVKERRQLSAFHTPTTWASFGESGQSESEPDVHLNDQHGSIFGWAPPADWTLHEIESVSAYYVRLVLKNSGDPLGVSALDGAVSIDVSPSPYRLQYVTPLVNPVRGIFSAMFPSSKKYILVSNKTDSSGPLVKYLIGSDHQFSDLINPDASRSDVVSSGSPNIVRESRYIDAAPATHAIVPQFGDGFIAYGGVIKSYSTRSPWEHGKKMVDSLGTGRHDHPPDAEVEFRDFAVGPGTPYDPNYVDTNSHFPSGSYISFYNGRLWVAGSKEEPFTVRWSAPMPFHKVWTDTANDILMEDDNSPITGMSPIGEHMAVFKRDSIWLMMNIGPNPATSVNDYRGRKIVEGVGCIAHSSIQQIRGGLVFLAEDGVYVFDGTPNIVKISDRVDDSIRSINPHKAAFVSSVHWKTRSCYLLSIPTNGSSNNSETLVYDYKNDAWWVWDIAAALWLNDEGQDDEETLYFIDNNLSMNRMGVGNTDHGGVILSHILTQRIGAIDNVRRTIRQIEVVSDNRTQSLSVDVRPNDDEYSDVSGVIDLTDSSEALYSYPDPDDDIEYGEANYVLKRRRARRISFRQQADWFQVKVSHSSHNTPMSMRVIDVGFIGGGRR